MDDKVKVLIIDDEYFIGQLVKKLIDWDRLNATCIGVVVNSEEGLEIIRKEAPDIVITDIRMPRITGLDLIRFSHEIHKDIDFIIVSGHREFEYAKEAMKYGVENYILKPIKEDELNNALEHTINTRNSRSEMKQLNTKMIESVEKSKGIIKRNWLRRIIETNEVETMDSTIHFDGNEFVGMVLKLDYIDSKNIKSGFDKQTCKTLISKLFDIASENNIDICSCYFNDYYIYNLLNFNEDVNYIEGISLMLAKANEKLSAFDLFIPTIGIGKIVDKIEEVNESLEQAKIAVDNRMKYGTSRIIDYKNIENLGDCAQIAILDDYIRDEFIKAIETYDIERFEHRLEEMFKHVKETYDYNYAMYYDLADAIINLYNAYENNQEEMDNSEIKMKIRHATTLNQFKQILSQEIATKMAEQKKVNESLTAKPVREVVDYIEKNYAEKNTIDEVLIELGIDLNPTYFSALFKKETGVNFMNYLVNVRMEKAKKLLLSTNDTVAMIGISVGYKDAKYFSQLFKKIVGVKPTLYRKLRG